MKNKNILSLAVILISILSAAFFLVLFSSVRYEPDDMIIRLECKENTLLQMLINHYNIGSFRPVYVLISYFTLGYNEIFIFYVLLYLLFIFTIYKLLQELFFTEKLTLKEKGLLIAFSNIAVICVYFLTTERIEIFGWVSASIIHLVPVVFALLSTWLIIKKQHKKSDYIWLLLCSFFVSGGAEHIAASAIASMLLIILFVFYSQRKRKEFFVEHKHQLKKAIFFFALLTICFAFFISNPGTQLRYQQENSFTQSHANLYSTSIFSMLCKPYKLMGLLFVFVFWMLFQNTFQVKKLQIKLRYFVIGFLCVLIITCLMSAFVFNTFSVGRIWFVLDVTLFVLLSACIIKLIHYVKINNMILYISASIFLITLVLFDIRHIPALLNFSSQHDKLIYSLQQKSAEETITLQNFPNPDLTNQVELSTDPNNDVNQLFCRFYNIKAKVSVKK